jgi:hypothetical protein
MAIEIPAGLVASSNGDTDVLDQESLERDPRRELIFRRVVLDNRPITVSELKKLAGPFTTPALHRDLVAFSKIGCRLEIAETLDGKDGEIYWVDGPHTDTEFIREKVHAVEKDLVARMAASLICGVPGPCGDSLLPNWTKGAVARTAVDRLKEHPLAEWARQYQTKDNEQNCPKLKTDKQKRAKVAADTLVEHVVNQLDALHGRCGLAPANDVLSMLISTGAVLDHRAEELKKNLYSFWAESSRLVAIDSGTTNIAIARYLSQLTIPLAGATLCSLTVCTNSRRIFEVLGPSTIWVKTIIIGGQQLFRSPTIAGTMAELFLRSVPILQFGMCILGSTRLDLDRFAVCSDSQEEASLKNLMMDRSSLRVVCVDDSKLTSGPGREGYKFASISPASRSQTFLL